MSDKTISPAARSYLMRFVGRNALDLLRVSAIDLFEHQRAVLEDREDALALAAFATPAQKDGKPVPPRVMLDPGEEGS